VEDLQQGSSQQSQALFHGVGFESFPGTNWNSAPLTFNFGSEVRFTSTSQFGQGNANMQSAPTFAPIEQQQDSTGLIPEELDLSLPDVSESFSAFLDLPEIQDLGDDGSPSTTVEPEAANLDWMQPFVDEFDGLLPEPFGEISTEALLEEVRKALEPEETAPAAPSNRAQVVIDPLLLGYSPDTPVVPPRSSFSFNVPMPNQEQLDAEASGLQLASSAMGQESEAEEVPAQSAPTPTTTLPTTTTPADYAGPFHQLFQIDAELEDSSEGEDNVDFGAASEEEAKDKMEEDKVNIESPADDCLAFPGGRSLDEYFRLAGPGPRPILKPKSRKH